MLNLVKMYKIMRYLKKKLVFLLINGMTRLLIHSSKYTKLLIARPEGTIKYTPYLCAKNMP